MTEFELVVCDGLVVLDGGKVVEADVGVRDGRIAAISPTPLKGSQRLDAAGCWVIPGVVDEHFHVFNGYGHESYENGTRAAAKGGVTTVIDMPLDDPPTLTAERLRAKREGVVGRLAVDHCFFGGFLAEAGVEEMGRMWAAGAVAFKLFTGGAAPPGMYPGVDSAEMLMVMREAARLGAPVTVHCENATLIDLETARLQAEGRMDLRAWSEARPAFAELDAIAQAVLLAEETGCRLVVVHSSTERGVDVVRAARERGVDAWIETCPHYLLVNTDETEDPRMKWGPPIRPKAAADALWRRLADGSLHTIASDHAPFPKVEGASIWEIAMGVGNGVEPMLSVVATEAIHGRLISIERVVEALCTTPARIYGLYPRKGALRVGADADLVLLTRDDLRVLALADLEYVGETRFSPFDGFEARCHPRATVLRGRVVARDGAFCGDHDYGRELPGPGFTGAG